MAHDLQAQDIAVTDIYIYPHWYNNFASRGVRGVDELPFPTKEMVNAGLWAPGVRTLYICHNCFQPFAGNTQRAMYAQHTKRCAPAGSVVYSDDATGLTVREVRGDDAQQTTLKLAGILALFVRDKIVGISLDDHCMYTHYVKGSFVGAFSVAPTVSASLYSISVYAVLPSYRSSGYGTFMIDLSRHLAHVRGARCTSSDRPLSDDGSRSHVRVWRRDIVRAIFKLSQGFAEMTGFSLAQVATEANVSEEDCVSTLASLGALRRAENPPPEEEGEKRPVVLCLSRDMVVAATQREQLFHPSHVVRDYEPVLHSPLRKTLRPS